MVGVNTAIFSPSGGSVGISFAVASDVAKGVVQQLKDNGKVARGWLGVQIQPGSGGDSLRLSSPRSCNSVTLRRTAPVQQGGSRRVGPQRSAGTPAHCSGAPDQAAGRLPSAGLPRCRCHGLAEPLGLRREDLHSRHERRGGSRHRYRGGQRSGAKSYFYQSDENSNCDPPAASASLIAHAARGEFTFA